VNISGNKADCKRQNLSLRNKALAIVDYLSLIAD
jgi:hypothetical protein